MIPYDIDPSLRAGEPESPWLEKEEPELADEYDIASDDERPLSSDEVTSPEVSSDEGEPR
jgi:hypothetical protein